MASEQLSSSAESSAAERFESANTLSLTKKGDLPVEGYGFVLPTVVDVAWTWVIHPRSPDSTTTLVGSLVEEESTLITPRLSSALPVSSRAGFASCLFTDSASRPSGDTKQLQQSCISWLSSNT